MALDLHAHVSLLEFAPTAVWLYDPSTGRNIWGNSAALGLFGASAEAFLADQQALWRQHPGFQPGQWQQANLQLQQLAAGAPGSNGSVSPVGAHAAHTRAHAPEAAPALVAGAGAAARPGVLPLPMAQGGGALQVSARPLLVQLPGGGAPVRVLVFSDLSQQQVAATDGGGGGVCGGARSALCAAATCPKQAAQQAATAASAAPGTQCTGLCTAAGPAPGAAAAAAPGGSVCSSHGGGGDSVGGLALQRRAASLEARAKDVRLSEMCDNHAMFQFLFDENGQLLAANRRALENMREHLGDGAPFTLAAYLAIGECDGGITSSEMYGQAMQAIFDRNAPCYRVPQLRWSKRHPGKYRWVLYEMWPMDDPVTLRPAVLVTEQNISQVKLIEEQYSKQMQRLEARLEEALAQQAAAERFGAHIPGIDIVTPAEKTLKLLERLVQGAAVTSEEAEELRTAILQTNDFSQPLNLNQQLLGGSSSAAYEPEVGASLLQLLSTEPIPKEQLGRGGGYGAERGSGSSGGRRSSDGSEAAVAGALLAGRGGGGNSSYGIPVGPAVPMPSAVRDLMLTVRQPRSDLGRVLALVDDWQFDSFELADVAHGRPLSLLAFHLLGRCGLIEKFNLDEVKLARFLMRIEDGYPMNPYHNRAHAADVLRTVHVLATRGGLMAAGSCDDLGLLAMYLSAIIHDFEHRGLNNDFLVRLRDSLAITYNDRSPLENHHLAATFQLLSLDEFNFCVCLPHKTKETLRKLMIDMVLATDMKQHFAIHGMFHSKLSHNTSLRISAGAGGAGGSGNLAPTSSMVLGGGGSGGRVGSGSSGGPARHGSSMARHSLEEEAENLGLNLQVALKCADLGHLAAPRHVHHRWVLCLEEELFRQGDREKHAGLTVSPLMDREQKGITKSQVGFFDIVALPLFTSFAQKFPDSEPLLEAVKDNYGMWRQEAAGGGLAIAGLHNGRTRSECL